MKRHFLTSLLFAAALTAAAQDEIKEDIALIKKNLVESKEKIKKYEWIETTVTYVKGDEKSKKQDQCYYGVDGKLVKVATGNNTKAKQPGGLRGKIAANKKEDMQEYIEKAIAKIHSYLPPDGAKLQQLYDAGKTTIQVLEPKKKFKLDFSGYNQTGDILSISIDKERKLITAIAVNTYIDDPKERVILNIRYDALPDGTQYPGETSLDAQAKDVKIVIQNSGHKKGAGA